MSDTLANGSTPSGLRETLTGLAGRADEKGNVGNVTIYDGPSRKIDGAHELTAYTKSGNVTVGEVTKPEAGFHTSEAIISLGRHTIVASRSAEGNSVETFGGQARLPRALARPLAPVIIAASRQYVKWRAR